MSGYCFGCSSPGCRLPIFHAGDHEVSLAYVVRRMCASVRRFGRERQEMQMLGLRG